MSRWDTMTEDQKEAARARNRAYYLRNKAKKRAHVAAYRQRNPDWWKRYPDERRARHAVTKALEAGRLTRKPCEVCGATPAEAHHDDYAKPLDVRWLCVPHHKEVHHG